MWYAPICLTFFKRALFTPVCVFARNLLRTVFQKKRADWMKLLGVTEDDEKQHSDVCLSILTRRTPGDITSHTGTKNTHT